MAKFKLSQIAAQFLILLGLFFFFFVIIFSVLSDRYYEMNREKISVLALDLVTYVQNEIILAEKVSGGYHRKFILPDNIGGFDYSIFIHKDEVIINVLEQDYFKKIPNITGYIRKGTNVIKKNESGIYLN